MPKQSNLTSMSIDQLLKLRSDIEQALSRRAAQLRNELSKLGSTSRGKLVLIRSQAGRLQSSTEINQEIPGPVVVRSLDGYGRN